MKSFCLIGENVSQSKSHIIHREFLLAYGTGGSYDLFNVPPDDFDRAIEKLKNHYDGFNVTMPYKERIINRLEGLSGAASACRSVNTVKISGLGNTMGYSTDGAGFLQVLKAENVNPAGKNILIIGSGGAAKAIAYALTEFDCRIYVYARNARNADQFVGLFKGRVGHMDSTLKNKYDIIVNCTPVGQQPFVNETPLPRDFLKGASFVFDAVYNPAETLLVSYAREAGIPAAGGMDMLIFQAYESQRIWQGRDLTEQKLCDTINRLKKELSK